MRPYPVNRGRPERLLVLFAAVLVALLAGCPHTTTPQTLLPEPGPPYGWPIFQQGFNHGDSVAPVFTATDYSSVSPVTSAAAGCPTSVVDPPGIAVGTSGGIVGSLKFNTGPRGSGNIPETNGGNTTLGGVHKQSGPVENWALKFQVSVSFNGPLANAFYGQMISDPMASAATGATFHDDTPANDSVGKKWDLPKGTTPANFPVIEIIGNTVRWIDAPQGATLGGQKYYLMFYAGACGKVTHVKFMRIDFPGGAPPTATELTDAAFKAEAGSFSFTTR